MIHRKSWRTALLAPLFCLRVVCFPADSSGALWRQPQSALSEGSVIERENGGDEQHVYLLPLAAGQFARIVVEQSDVDAVLTLFKPDGQPSAEVNNYPRHEPEYLSLIAEAPGDYRLKVAVADPRAARAKYKIRVADLRLATPRDAPYAEAERTFSEATRLFHSGNADSPPQVAAIYE